MELTKYELETMEVFWAAGRPLARHDLLEAPHHWKDSSIHIILNGMISKGAIKTVGCEKRTKIYSRTFSPVISRERYWVQLAYSQSEEPGAIDMIVEVLRQAHIHPEAVGHILKEAKGQFEGSWYPAE